MENEEKNAVQPDAPAMETNEPDNQETPLFRNVFTANEADLMEAFRALMQQTMREKRFFLWFSWAAAALAVVVAVFAIFEDRNYPYAAAMLGLAVILVFLREGFPRIFSRKLAKNSMKQMQEAYGQPETQESFFYEDSLRLYTPNTKGELCYGYQAVAVCMETETLLLLQTQQKQLVILPKNSFTGIDRSGFKAFMREKAPGAKFRW